MIVRQPSGTHIAQVNIGRAVDDLDSPLLAEFTRSLAHVNGLADAAPGFVWRLADDSGGGVTDIQATDNPRDLVNLSVWQTVADLERFVWQTVHKNFYLKRDRWFLEPTRPSFVLWWVSAGHRPTVNEAMARLDDLRANGVSERAFTWREAEGAHLFRDVSGMIHPEQSD